jgi:hypothetical protein
LQLYEIDLRKDTRQGQENQFEDRMQQDLKARTGGGTRPAQVA